MGSTVTAVAYVDATRVSIRESSISFNVGGQFDFVLNGGEVAAMCVIEATMRLIPGALGDAESSLQDSFANPIRYTHSTRDLASTVVTGSEVLLGGNHQEIAAWRSDQSARRTAQQSGQKSPPLS